MRGELVGGVSNREHVQGKRCQRSKPRAKLGRDHAGQRRENVLGEGARVKVMGEPDGPPGVVSGRWANQLPAPWRQSWLHQSRIQQGVEGVESEVFPGGALPVAAEPAARWQLLISMLSERSSQLLEASPPGPALPVLVDSLDRCRPLPGCPRGVSPHARVRRIVRLGGHPESKWLLDQIDHPHQGSCPQDRRCLTWREKRATPRYASDRQSALRCKDASQCLGHLSMAWPQAELPGHDLRQAGSPGVAGGDEGIQGARRARRVVEQLPRSPSVRTRSSPQTPPPSGDRRGKAGTRSERCAHPPRWVASNPGHRPPAGSSHSPEAS